ncbi:hypothetical protein MBLNU457_g0600t1 [Dothideomycetes sp. NU457]
MRFSAIIPIVLGLGALVLSFLALFAGSRKGFMEDYAVVTLNTSRIGQNVINSTQSSSSNPVISFFHNLTANIENEINNDLNSFAKDLGVHDFYSAHILDFCEGYYTPTSVPNATIKSIHQNVTFCSNRTAFFQFDPRYTLQRELNASGHGNINLTALHWPDSIDKGLQALHEAQKAAFILYCIGIGMIGIVTLLAIVSIFFEGRLSASVNILVTALAFMAIAIASALTTVIAVKAANLINKYGNPVGISATKGSKFIILTWVATGLVFINLLVWCFACAIGRGGSHRTRKNEYVEH